MKQKLWITLATYLAYCIDKELYKAIDYLREFDQMTSATYELLFSRVFGPSASGMHHYRVPRESPLVGS